jgi:sialate O-acetylesterase
MKTRLFLFFILIGTSATALELPHIFSDHMVLQQQATIRIWGKADPAATVQVQLAEQDVSTETDSQGRWSVALNPMQASFEAKTLTVRSGASDISFEDVLIGEVWLGSGQSNMSWMIKQSVDGDITSLGADDPYLRLYKVAYHPSQQPEFSNQAVWSRDSPGNCSNFSAVAYHFARHLRQTLNVPVGIINSSVGGTPVIAWTRQQAFSNYAPLAERAQEWEKQLANYDANLAAWNETYRQWRQKRGLSAENYRLHRRQGAPLQPEGPNSQNRPANLANGMITPVAPYALRGVIWYQGEADAGWAPELYGKRLGVMIDDWRAWWQMPDMAFGIVQLPNFKTPRTEPSDDSWPKLRESQRKLALSDPHTGMAVTIDQGEEADIHPANKLIVARRLVRWALADVYDKLALGGGPQIAGARLGDNGILLTFDQVGRGLFIMDAKQLGGFTVEDSSGTFVKVPAKIVSANQVWLSTQELASPKRVRYAWQNNPVDASLGNVERLPASPFEIKLEDLSK